MKYLVKITYILLFSIILLPSCNPDNFLEFKPRGKDVPSEWKHYDGLLTQFDMIKWDLSDNGTLYFPALSDEYTTTKSGYDQIGASIGEQGRKCYKYDPDFLYPDDMPADWGYNANMYTLNLIINNVLKSSGSDEASKLSTQSEARVMRAWILFRVAQIYLKPYNEATAATDHGLPIITVANTLQETFNRATVKELYDFITTEMEESCGNIKNSTAYTFRTERPEAYAMLGTVYQYMKKYDKSLEAMRLAKRYADEAKSMQFYNLNTMEPATILYDGVYHFKNIEYMRNLVGFNTLVVYYYPFYYIQSSVFAKSKYFALYSATDRRQYRFLNENGNQRVVKGNNTPMGITSYGLLLTLAEAEARVGDMESAKADLYELRKYRMPVADAPVPSSIDTKDKLIRFCVEENIREHLGDGLFYFDMKRLWSDPLFADLKPDYCHEIIGTSEKYPFTEAQLEVKIPEAVLKWNTNWNK